MVEQIILGIIKHAVFLATPYFLAGLGETISERAGIVNIGLEGYMYFSAFTSYIVAFLTNNVFLGLLAGIVSGIILSIINAYYSIFIKAPQIITGIALNIFAIGLSEALYKIILGTKPPAPVESFKDLEIMVLKDIPVLGYVLFRQPLFIYIWLILFPTTYFIFHKTTWGLILRSTGEDPIVVKSVGVNFKMVQFISNIICGALSGLAGAFMSTCYLSYFIHGITAGRGFIVIALVIAGGWSPIGLLIVSSIYGFIESLQMMLQVLGVAIPYPFLMMLPYLVTIIILMLKREDMPKYLGTSPPEE